MKANYSPAIHRVQFQVGSAASFFAIFIDSTSVSIAHKLNTTALVISAVYTFNHIVKRGFAYNYMIDVATSIGDFTVTEIDVQT